ncbi:MAG: enoyl-CoA hydratase/isomerase family protein [Allosphingosinicella sp.]|uniref:enoyl-CoA hydratase/isomerase family protein n=1 Tax=Allosphingosinicella sp. TaxID=2823234 RepID=UPI0039400198
MDFERYQSIACSRRGRVLTLRLNSGEPLNAVSQELHHELGRVFYDAADDPDSDVIVLTGTDPAFSAGGDVNWLARQVRGEGESFVTESRTMRAIVHGLLDCPKPVVAAVNGDAFGIGASLALLCDIVIAVDTARFADPHVRLGLSAGDGGALIWPQLIGFAKAKHYLLTGEPIGAIEAERINLITFAKPADEFQAFVDTYADRLARGAQTAIRYTKSTTNLALRELFNSVFEAGVAYEGQSRETDDFREAVSAFMEKRKPNFGGR